MAGRVGRAGWRVAKAADVGEPDNLVSCSVRLLGAVEVRCADRVVELGPPKQRILMVALALSPNEIVSADRLIELMWGDDPPRTAAHSVQIYVSGLRKALAGLVDAPRIETRSPGYRLTVDVAAVDVSRFTQLVAAGRDQMRRGDAGAAATSWQAALDLWRGEPLADFAYAEFAQPHIHRLHQLQNDAIEGLTAAQLECGHTNDALRLAEAMVDQDPLNDRAAELLMSALYRSGHHVQALRAFQRHRDALIDVGVVPTPPLQRLHERILLHDPSLLVDHPPRAEIGRRAHNPYKGLRPFGEHDANDYFGREVLVATMVRRLGEGSRLLAIVGPSGSGKSSAVAAGLIPRLRAGAIPGSEQWLVASFVPGPRPLQETDAVIARAAAVPVRSHDAEHRLPGMLHEVAPPTRVMLFIDQFEELFMASDEATHRHYLETLAGALADHDGRLTVVLTLRADHYDRPLLHPQFAEIFTAGVLNVLPMTAAELTAAVTAPAAAAGLDVDPNLVAELVTDTVSQPGSLPLMQYTLAEQVDRTTGLVLSLEDYTALGGVRATLTRRADELFASLSEDRQRIATQVLLRMVRIGDGVGDACRSVPVAELAQLNLDPVALSDVLETFVRHRLLASGNDPVTNRPTIGVAHEALLDEWEQLAGWVSSYRLVLRRYDALRAATIEWEDSNRDPDYLLSKSRVKEAAAWRSDVVLPLTAGERQFIDASIAHHAAGEAAETERLAAHQRLERRARRRLVGLSTIALLLAAATVVAVVAITGIGGAAPQRIALFYHDSGEVSGLIDHGYDRAVADFGFRADRFDEEDLDSTRALEDVAGDEDAVVDWTLETDVESVARDHRETRFVVLDRPMSGPNVSAITFAANEGSYLAGAAAALESTTGTIGFIGGVDMDIIWQFQAGFEAGAREVDPDVRILDTYLAEPPHYAAGFRNAGRGERAARLMYGQGADVIFAAAGTGGLGVFQAATDLSGPGRQLWAIGVDSDQYNTVLNLPGTVDPKSWTPHILSSVVKRYDTAVYSALAAIAAGDALPSRRLGLAERGVELSYSGGFLDRFRPRLEALRQAIIDGRIVVPCLPLERETAQSAHASTCPT